MDTQHNEGKTEKVTVYLPVNFKEPESISGVPNFYLDEFVNGKWEPKCYVKPAQGYFSEFEPSTLPPPVSRTAEEIEQMAYEIYPHDVPIESPGDQCKNFHYRQAYISGFKKAMELYRTQPEEREEMVRIAGEAFDAGMEHEYEKHFGAVPPLSPNKEQYLSQIK